MAHAAEKVLPPLTRFTSPEAVDLWDSRFRWRSGGRLRDRTVDATWQRVASALAARDGDDRGYWRGRYAFCFSQWQILPDPRLLCFAGTELPVPLLRDPVGVVNAGVFVVGPGTRHARFDHARFAAAAAVAVRMLDDAVLRFGPDERLPMRLGVGLIGLADAFAALGLGYDSARAPLMAQAIAQSLALGCLRGSLSLVKERGNRAGGDGASGLASLWRPRALPAELADAVALDRRHECLTRIDSQPELALLANAASDSLEPTEAFQRGAKGGDVRAVRRAIRNAVRPWIDVPPGPAPRARKAEYADA